MDTSTIGGVSGGTGVLSASGGQFGDDQFLRVLVTQMQSQTPLSPVDNGEFLQQMASYSSMKEQRQLNQSMLELLSFQGALARVQGLAQGSALLGKDVTYDLGDGIVKTGTVDSVFVDDQGEVKVIVAGAEVPLQSITGIAQPAGSSGS